MTQSFRGPLRNFAILLTVFWASNVAWGATLVWDPNNEPDLAGYRVYFREQASTSYEMVDVGLETSVKFDRLVPGITYEFYATAYNLAGLESAPSEMVVYTVPAAALQVEWEKSPYTEVVNYNVYYGEVNRATQSISAKRNLSLPLADLLPGRTYYFYAAAFDAEGTVLDRYGAVTYTMPEDTSPGVVRLKRENRKPAVVLTSPAANGAYTVSAAIPLQVSVSDEDGTIERVDYYVSTSLIASTEETPFSGSWTPLSPGTYYFTAIALDNDGAAGVSPVQTITIQPAPPAPPAPAQITTLAGNGMVRITWEAAARAESYNLYRATSWSGPFQRIGSTEFPSFLDGTALNGTRYFYQVTANNSQGESDPSPMAVATPLPPPPTAPSSLRASAQDGAVILEWPEVERATAYVVHRATSWSGPFVSLGVTSSTLYLDLTAANGTRYYYKVHAQNAGGTSGASPMAAVVPVLPAPNSPESLTAAEVEAGVRLTWSETEGATSYDVHRAINVDGPYEKIGSATSNSYTDSDVSEGTSYFYRVTAANSSGTSSPSATAVASIPAAVAAPDAPTTLTANGSSGGVTLSWPSMDRTTTYQIYRSTTFAGPFEKVGAVTRTLFTDAAAARETRYYYYVTAQNGGGESEPSPMTFVVLW